MRSSRAVKLKLCGKEEKVSGDKLAFSHFGSEIHKFVFLPSQVHKREPVKGFDNLRAVAALQCENDLCFFNSRS